ncbi:DHS-like NAD/FAD-binding domain-containing protein [Karstenula rhodostoma CBS 690.94]|uniref:DHS-like NAD/FAD-binding domain-containing protein n=1 Tax=Karstenula rhodostoma CBS 690.94 TaxID=1392251 RepID=A0A9P4PEY4_9PLEO|nr:DHS-like NAD/FAD-binding domain-containing protein [Karstenula rhodostoma CBS 690.94]
MQTLSRDFKDELRAKANASLQRHYKNLDAEARSIKHDPPSGEMLASFTTHLQSSNRILVLIGAGLSASSGIPTYRSAGGFWRTFSDQQLAKKSAFEDDPILVWQFYDYRRQQAKAALPNPAHHALAEMAARKPGLLSINQNVDELCQRAAHPAGQIINLHGSLFRVKCFDDACGYEEENHAIPVIPQFPATEPPRVPDSTNTSSSVSGVSIDDLPHCPKCKVSLLRPAAVWFGEGLPEDKVNQVEQWMRGGSDASEDEKVDLMLVVGTSAMVWPAAGYIGRARKAGARVAYFNMEEKSAGVARPEDNDWMFLGDAAELVPKAFEGFLSSVGN